MRPVVLLSRVCARRASSQAPKTVAKLGRWHSTFRFRLPGPSPRQSPRFKGKILLTATANVALGTATFVKLSEKDNGNTEHTAEERMLAASREELKKTVDEDENGLYRFGHRIYIFLDLYFWEPLCTGVRFVELVFIFLPVIFTVPAIWIGSRQSDRDNERSGTLWWYNFLVKSMERAGPAFIKVR